MVDIPFILEVTDTLVALIHPITSFIYVYRMDLLAAFLHLQAFWVLKCVYTQDI